MTEETTIEVLRYPTRIRQINGTWYLKLSPPFVQYLEITEPCDCELMTDNGKHGKFIAFWKKK